MSAGSGHNSGRKVQQAGFGIIEVLITAFIIAVVVTGMFGLFVLAMRSAQESERRVVAVALANERSEMIRNLPYNDVGTVGGVPVGSIAQQETITRNNLNYTVKTDIRYVDDPFDGTAGGTPNDFINTDYKQARIEVGWNSNLPAKPILLITVIAPQGIEGGDGAGTLVFQAVDTNGNGVEGATVTVTNEATNPDINITTQTNADGELIIPGLPEANESYEVTVSKSGYNQEQTYDKTATFFPDTDHSHLTALAGQLTNKTFQIDQLGSLTLHFVDATDQPMPNIAYTFRGEKTIGVDNQSNPVYVVDDAASSNSTGQAQYNDLAWDTYQFAIDGAATGYDIKETSKVLPFSLEPNEDADVQVVLVEHTNLSLHITVANSEGVPVDNATVHVTGNGFDQSLGTGIFGQVFFTDLQALGDYTIDISAPGYDSVSEVAPIDGTERLTFVLNASS